MLVNAYSTVPADTPPEFAQVTADRALYDADGRYSQEMVDHIRGFQGYVTQRFGGDATAALLVLIHLGMVKRQYSFTVEGQAQLDRLTEWGWATNSILFLEDGDVTDPAGRSLLPGGDGDVPILTDGFERAQRQRQLLAARGVHVSDALPPGPSLPETLPQTARTTATRFATLVLVCNGLRGDHTLATHWPQAAAGLSPDELRALNDGDERLATALGWRVEAATQLAWALGLVPLRWPDEQSDLEPLVALLRERGPEERFLAEARLRPTEELLDEYHRCHGMLWRARQDRIDGHPSTVVDEGIVQERTHAMAWLIDIRLEDWDDVDTST